jgi:hypothetical protein
MSRVFRAARRALAGCMLWLVAGCAKDTIIPITQVMVVVHSDLKPGTELRQVNIEVQDEAGTHTHDRRTFNIGSGAKDSGLFSLPLSFSVVEPSEQPAPRFRLAVTGTTAGREGSAPKSVRQVAVVGFQPGLTVRLTVYLAQVCLQSACDALDQTCSPTTTATTVAGACGSVLPQDDLSPVTPGMEAVGVDWPGGGLTGPSAAAALDGGSSQSCDPLRVGLQPAADACDGSVPSQDAKVPDAAAPVGDADAGAPGTGSVTADAGREGGVPLDAGRDAGDASEAGANVGVDAGNPRNCLNGITSYQGAGPFSFAEQIMGAVKFWVPGVPAGCRVPVVHFANGTGASCSTYRGILERLASHGFLAACHESTNTGNGTGGLLAFETALSMFPDLADNKLGTMGQNQGGQAAFVTLYLAEQKWSASMTFAGLAVQPSHGFGGQPAGMTWQEVYAKIRSPMFMFSGTEDTLVSASWVQQGYDALPATNEAYCWSAIGATHTPVPVAPTQQVSIPWFRWKLLGDQAACAHFKRLPDGINWEKKASKNEKACE